MLKKMTPGQWILLAITIVLIAFAAWVYYADALSSQESQALIASHKIGVGQLTQDAPASQTFTVAQDGFCGVEVMFSNYNKKVKTGTLTLWLTDGEGKELARQEYPVAELKNNAFVSLSMSGVSGSAGKPYTLYAASDCVEQKGVTVRMGPVEAPVGELVLADGTVTTENALNLRILYEVKTNSTLGGGALLLIALCLMACIPLAGGKERRHA